MGGVDIVKPKVERCPQLAVPTVHRQRGRVEYRASGVWRGALSWRPGYAFQAKTHGSGLIGPHQAARRGIGTAGGLLTEVLTTGRTVAAIEAIACHCRRLSRHVLVELIEVQLAINAARGWVTLLHAHGLLAGKRKR